MTSFGTIEKTELATTCAYVRRGLGAYRIDSLIHWRALLGA